MMAAMKMLFSLLLLVACDLSTVATESLKGELPVESGRVNLNQRDSKSFFSDSKFSHGENHKRSRRQAACFPPISCSPTFLYRTMDGTCNNLVNDVYAGSANIPFVRWLTPQYGPGNTIRGTGFSPALPSARTVSAGMVSVVNPPTLVPDAITLMVMQWGQFIDHDMVFTPEENATSCCNNTSNVNCINIAVLANDSFYGSLNVICLPLVRSRASPCAPSSVREQINERTAFLDASQVYGSSDAQLFGQLLLTGTFLLRFGPQRENTACATNNPSFNCRSFLPEQNSPTPPTQEFFAGDARVEETPGLASIHTIFLRMHNDLATQISILNPSCANADVFLETRKIVGALIQQITYGEFLPIVVGPTTMSNFGLTLATPGTYNPNLDPSAPNVFATAAFRFGHSLITNAFNLPSGAAVQLAQCFNIHSCSINNIPSQFVRGISVDSSEPMDHILADAVHNKLFAQSPSFTQGEDLYARNIQRSRDHGLPPYPDWINQPNGCFPRTANSFSDLNSFMPSQVVAKLQQLYGSLSRVDLFPAAIAEHNVAGGLVGPTFACLISEYFRRLKFGDRFWFEQSTQFSSSQLTAIYNTRLSAIICRYTDATQLPPNVFLPVSASNPMTNCSSLTSNSVLSLISLWGNQCFTAG